MGTTEHGITPFGASGIISFWWGHHNAPSEEDWHNGANHQRLGQVLGMDRDSGGYPWIPPGMYGWHYWSDPDAARKYADSFEVGTAYEDMVKAPLSVFRIHEVTLQLYSLD